jgi:hypothetical protein
MSKTVKQTLGDRGGNKSKKGQAALEYLVTYGWALILIFGIIALLYAYVFKPEFYVAESCNMAPGIDCGTFTLAQEGTDMILTLNLANGMDFAIVPQQINITTQNFLEAGEIIYTWDNDDSGASTIASVLPSTVNSKDDMQIKFRFDATGKEIPRPATLQRMKFAMAYNIPTGSTYRTAGILNIKVS